MPAGKVSDPSCTATSNHSQVVTSSAVGCPGLSASTTIDGTTGWPVYTGLACNAHGTCTANHTCTCFAGYERGLSGSCDTLEATEEPTAMLPMIVAGIGLLVFCLVLSVMRLKEALRLNSAAGKAEYMVEGKDVTLMVLAVHLAHKAGDGPAPAELQSNSSAIQLEMASGTDKGQPEPAPKP